MWGRLPDKLYLLVALGSLETLADQEDPVKYQACPVNTKLELEDLWKKLGLSGVFFVTDG